MHARANAHAHTRGHINMHTPTLSRKHARLCVCACERADVMLPDYFVEAVMTMICFVLLQQTVDERTNVVCV